MSSLYLIMAENEISSHNNVWPASTIGMGGYHTEHGGCLNIELFHSIHPFLIFFSKMQLLIISNMGKLGEIQSKSNKMSSGPGKTFFKKSRRNAKRHIFFLLCVEGTSFSFHPMPINNN